MTAVELTYPAFLSVYGDFLGRRISVALGALLFLAGGILQTAAQGIGMLYAGRCVGGLGVGLLSGTVPLYISECAPTSIRGRVGTMQQLMITIGIMLANGKLERALAILARLNAQPQESDYVQQQVADIQESIEIEKRLPKASWLDMLRFPIRRRSFAAFFLFFFQQWSGINAVMYYSSSLFLGMGLSKDIATKVATTVQSVINVLATLPAIYLIERLGRRRLLLVGALGCSFFMWSLVLWVGLFNGTQIADPVSGQLIPNPNSGAGRAYGVLGVLAMYMYVVCFAGSWGPVGWVYISEIFPLRARGKGASVGSMSHWIWNFVIAKVWPYVAVMGAWQYTIFGGSTVVAFVFVYFFVPETRGRSLEEMDEVFGAPAGSGLTEEEKRVLAELRKDPNRADMLETGKSGGH
ncbi:hypothetical protein HDU93_008548 [Gonapodya sp. JEL0774]|nr:hypothetical protein HDU93_008548 [Gonapodya sp. JEL0774]